MAIGALAIAGVGREVTMRWTGGNTGTLSRVAETGALVVDIEVRIEVDVEFGQRIPGSS